MRTHLIRRGLLAAVAAGAMVAVPLVGSGTAQALECVTAACANAHQPIYFVASDPPVGAHTRVFRMYDDGGAPTPITGDISPDNSIPDISIDRSRTKLAILARGTGPGGVDTVSIGNIDGTGQHVVASSATFNGISLSPDGSTVAIADGDNVEIPTPFGPHILATTAGTVSTVAWAPDGRRIAFDVGEGRGAPLVWVINADGTNPMVLTVGREPAWSPDGTRIGYAFDAPDQLRWAAVTPNPTPHVVASFPSRVGWPTWSPDGSWIAYEIWLPNQHVAIRKIHVDGTTNTQLALDGFQVTWGYPPAKPISPPFPGP